MEREVWTRILAHLHATRKEAQGRRFVYVVDDIVRVFLWAALHERPIYWACRRQHWPHDLCPPRLPTPSTMTRRLRTPAVQSTLQAVERRSRGRRPRGLLHIVDGKPLPIGYHSRDAEAGFGRGAGQMAKGYKLHMIAGAMGEIRAWCVRPIHHDEAKLAAQLLAEAGIQGYLLGDANYDRNALYQACGRRHIQFLAPRRYGPQHGLGHCRQDPARLRAVELLEHSHTGFGPRLMAERARIERFFGSLSSSSYGLPSLPPWVRHLDRVTRWITAKFIIWNCVQKLRKRAG